MSKLVLVADETAPSAPAAGQAIYTESGRLKRQDSGATVRYLDAVSGAGVLTLATNTAITGGGTIALGGYTLTVPATGTAALRGTAQTFTAGQTISTAGGGSPEQLLIQQSGNNAIRLYTTSAWGLATNGALLQMYNGAATEILRLDTRSGNQSYALGHVGIGTTTDSAQLSVKAGSASTVGLVVDTAATPSASIAEYHNSGTAKLKISTQGILDFAGTMGNSTKTVGTDAPADWVQVAIGGTTYYLPAYAA